MHCYHRLPDKDHSIYFDGMLCLLDNLNLIHIRVDIQNMDHRDIRVNTNKYHGYIEHFVHKVKDYMDLPELDLFL